MSGDYVGFVAAAYGFSGLALLGLGVWIFLDGRAARRRLSALEEAGLRRRRSGERNP